MTTTRTAALGAALIAAVGLSACGGSNQPLGTASLAKVNEDCTAVAREGDVASYITLSAYDEADRTLVIDGAGREGPVDDVVSPAGKAGLVLMQCVLERLDAPERVHEHIGVTRALDGQQTDAWDQFEARWTYHPDAGLNLTIWMAS